VKENDTEGVYEPRTLDASVREPYGVAQWVLVQMLPPSVQNIPPCHGVLSGPCEVADQRLFWSENEDNLLSFLEERRTFQKEIHFYYKEIYGSIQKEGNTFTCS
jgi:hypothetical protein